MRLIIHYVQLCGCFTAKNEMHVLTDFTKGPYG